MILNREVLITLSHYIGIFFWSLTRNISITQGKKSVQSGERVTTEPEVKLSMNILTTNAKQKHTQGKLTTSSCHKVKAR